MKRLILPSTASAKAWWQANPSALKADLFSIALPNGETVRATDGQWDITVPSGMSPSGSAVTFRSRTYGVWTRGPITSEAGFRCQANNMTLSVVPKIGSTYPGLNISTLNAAVNHLYDGAHVTVWTAWMPFGGFGNVQVLEPKWQGWILEAPQVGRVLCQFNCGDPFFLLNQKVPSRLLQSGCYKSFTDSNCGLNPTAYTVTFTAGAASNRYSLTPLAGFSQPDGYFTEGVATCLTGANAGLSATVKSHVSGVLTLSVPFLLPVTAGETFSVIKGCNHTLTTCAGMTRADGTPETSPFTQRFGGTPFVPVPSSVI